MNVTPRVNLMLLCKKLLLLFIVVVVLMMTAGSCNSSSGGRNGEVIPMQQRTQFNNQRTPWTPVELKLNPRFGMRKTAEINGVVALLRKFHPQPNAQQYQAEQQAQDDDDFLKSEAMRSGFGEDDTIKIAFSFEDNEFVTPWISVMRKGGKDTSTMHVLTGVDFIFKHVGSRILQVKHVTHYAQEEEQYFDHINNANRKKKKKSSGDKVTTQNMVASKIPETIKLTYHWEEVLEKDATSGIILLYFTAFIGGIAAILIVVRDFIPQAQLNAKK